MTGFREKIRRRLGVKKPSGQKGRTAFIAIYLTVTVNWTVSFGSAEELSSQDLL
jgi:hypothetical protein